MNDLWHFSAVNGSDWQTKVFGSPHFKLPGPREGSMRWTNKSGASVVLGPLPAETERAALYLPRSANGADFTVQLDGRQVHAGTTAANQSAWVARIVLPVQGGKLLKLTVGHTVATSQFAVEGVTFFAASAVDHDRAELASTTTPLSAPATKSDDRSAGRTWFVNVSAPKSSDAPGSGTESVPFRSISGGCWGRGSAPELSVAGTSYFFGNNRFVLEFDSETNGLINVTACDPISGSWQGFLLPSPPPAPVKAKSAVPLWILSLSDLCQPPNASVVQAGLRMDGLSSPSHSRGRSVAMDAQQHSNTTTLTLIWRGVSVLNAQKQPLSVDVNVTVTMEHGASGVDLHASIVKRPNSSSFCLQTLALPNLEWTILRDSDDHVFVPHFFGHSGDLSVADGVCGYGSCDLSLADSRASTDIYSGELNLQPQGNERSMDWAATWTAKPGGGSGSRAPLGLYLGAHDPDSRLKLLTATGSRRGSEADPAGHAPGTGGGLRYYHLPDDLIDTAVGGFVLPYSVRLQGFAGGDWFDAAMIRRSWAQSSASWLRQGNLTARAASEPGYPHWLLTSPFWANCNGYDLF